MSRTYEEIIARIGTKDGTRDGMLFASALPLLHVAYKLVARKSRGPRPFQTVDFVTNAKLINQVIFDINKYYDRNIYNKTIPTNIGTVARFLLDASKEVVIPSLRKDFVFLANQLNSIKICIQNRK